MKNCWKESLTCSRTCVSRMPKLARQYFDEGRDALAPGTCLETDAQVPASHETVSVHARIFKDLYGPGLAKRIDSLKKVQTYLGEINDCIVTSEMLKDMEGMNDIRDKLKEKADDKIAKLREFWADTFDAEGAERAVDTLSCHLCMPALSDSRSQAPK